MTQLSNNHQLTWQNSVKREFSNFGFEQIFVIHTMPKSMIKEKRSYWSGTLGYNRNGIGPSFINTYRTVFFNWCLLGALQKIFYATYLMKLFTKMQRALAARYLLSRFLQKFCVKKLPSLFPVISKVHQSTAESLLLAIWGTRSLCRFVFIHINFKYWRKFFHTRFAKKKRDCRLFAGRTPSILVKSFIR